MRAVLGMPLGGTELRVGASLMLNVLGDPGGSMEETTKVLKQALPVPGKGERERDRRRYKKTLLLPPGPSAVFSCFGHDSFRGGLKPFLLESAQHL